MSVRVVVEPVSEPVTLQEAKLHLRVDGSDEDTLISALIVAARQACESHAERSLAAKTYEVALDEFPDQVMLPYPPVLTVVSVQYLDTAGVLQTLSSPAYALDSASEPGWLMPAYGTEWPATQAAANAVKVRYTAGACPARAKQAILLMLAHWYTNREASNEKGTKEVPLAATYLLEQLRVW